MLLLTVCDFLMVVSGVTFWYAATVQLSGAGIALNFIEIVLAV